MAAPTKRILANVTLMVFALLFAFAIGEGIVRLLYRDKTVMFPRYHTDYRYGRYTLRGIRPNTEFWHTSVDGSWKFDTDSKGFRNRQEFTYSKSPNAFRVLDLGDSQTQGYEVRQDLTFSAVLERLLKAHNMRAEVINAGVSGFSTAEELAFLENEGFKYSPDVVVVGFFANDFEDNVKAGLFSLDRQNRLVEAKFEHIPGVHIQNVIYRFPGVKWLSEYSYFYSLLFNAVWNHYKARLGEDAAQRAGAQSVVPAGEATNAEYAVATSETHSDYEIALASALIERMHRFCQERGIRFIVVDIPTKPGPYRFASSLPASLLEKMKAANIEYISSQSVFSDFDRVAEMHALHGQGHISEFSHTLIAREIGRRLINLAPREVSR